jgi:eukaryotic-like serine/threonine-protein kinase
MESRQPTRETEAAPPPYKKLESWKEIANYLRRDVTTVQRWEKREGLPVHRHQHDRQGTVLAYSHELDLWISRRQVRPDASAGGWLAEAAGAPRLGRRAVGGLAVALAVLVAAAASLVTLNRRVVRGSPRPVQARFTIVPPPLNTFNQLAISSDGQAIVYATGPLLYRRRLDAVQPQPLADTQGAYDPFFAPDGGWLGYFVGDELKKMRATGGPPQTLAPARRGAGASWSPSGEIVFAADRGATIWKVAESGGDLVAIRRASERKGWAALRWPHVLPDGRQFLYFVRSDDMEVQGIYLGALTRSDASEDRRVVAADSNVLFGSGHLAFVRRGQLHAQPFDPSAGQTTGAAFPIAERVDQDPYDDGFAMFALSGNGVLTYRGGVTPDRQLRWFDRTGKVVGAVDAAGEYRDLAVSRDGKLVAYELMDAHLGTRDIWVRDLARDTRLRLTSTPDEDGAPVWAPDGGSVVFGGLRDRQIVVLRRSAAGGDTETLATVMGFPQDWSPDGRQVALEVTTPTKGSDLMLLDLSSKTLTPYLATPFMEREAQFSPDGRFMAYSSSESRQREVYVEPIPRDGRRWQVSTDYGKEPRWRGDGRELFYLGREDQLTAVAVRPAPGGLEFDRPVALFRLRVRGADVRYHYAVSRDGQRFLVNTVVEDVPGTPIHVWVNWLAGVAKGTDD